MSFVKYFLFKESYAQKYDLIAVRVQVLPARY